MADDIKIAVFDNGELTLTRGGGRGNEAVLALPLERLLVKIVKIPNDIEGSPDDFLTAALKAISPYPDDPLTVSYEIVRETESYRIALAAAMPENSADDIADALDAAKVNVTRIDSIELGFLRVTWNALGVSGDNDRRIVFYASADRLALFVFDGDCPLVMRAVSHSADLKREVILSLIEAESIAGAMPLKEIVVAGDMQYSELEQIAKVRCVDISGVDPVNGVAERSFDTSSFNLLPDSWREVLEEERFKKKVFKFIIGAAVIWLGMLSVVFGVPYYYEFQASKQNQIRKEHQRMFRRVNEKKEQVEAVRNVSNHDLGALESLRVVCEALPEGVQLSRWNFRRGDILTFSGVSDDGNHQRIYDFKDAISSVTLSHVSGLEDDAQTPYFKAVQLPRGIVSRNSKASFDIECDFKDPEENY